MPQAKREWGRVNGPATATWVTLKRLGWKFIGPAMFEDGSGARFDVSATSPLKMKERLVRAARVWTMKAGMRSAGFGEAEAESGRMEWDWVRKVLHGRHGGPAEERGGVRATIDGSAWTESRLWKAGYREDQKCACGHEVGNTPHRVIRCPLHSDDRAGLSELFIREVEGFLGDEVMSVRAHRLFPMMKKAYPAAPCVADIVIQEVRWREGHGIGYHDTAEWDEEDAAAMDEVRLDGVKMSTGHEFSVEVLEECRRWKERERRAGSMPQDPIEGWVCTDGSALDGNGQVMSRVGASLVQMGGGGYRHDHEVGRTAAIQPGERESVLLQPRGRQAHKR